MGQVSLRRLPQAILAGLRIVFFRVRLPYIELSGLEILFFVMYLGGCLIWTFVPGENNSD